MWELQDRYLSKTNYFDDAHWLGFIGAPVMREENANCLTEYDEKQGNPLTLKMAHGAARAGGIWNENRTVTELQNGVYTPAFSIVISNEAWAKISSADQAAITAISGEDTEKPR